MKSIFTRPLFINPQAYLTIPELSYIQMATPFDFTEDSYSFVINTSGRIEGKLLKTSNDYILHLDLYSIDGNCVLGEFYLNNSELNIDNFNLAQSKNIIILQFGEQSSGNITYPGLIAAWSAKGKTNDDADRAILKDLTGNGHDITLNGFAFSKMSGYGGYNVKPFTEWYNKNSFATVVNSTTVKIPKVNTPWDFAFSSAEYPKTPIIFKVKSDIDCTAAIHFKCKKEGSSLRTVYEQFSLTLKANIITPITIYSDAKVPENCTFSTVICFFIAETLADGKKLTIELIPEYPDALVFDGVDDYGFCANIPLLEDYTIIAKRKDCSGGCLFTKGENTNGAFVLEGYGFVSNTYNYGKGQNKNLLLNNTTTWQNKNSYNQQNLIVGDKSDTANRINIGKLNSADGRHLKGAFYSAYLFDRSLDEQEIKAFIRKYIDPEYFLPSEISTPDCYYDFSQGSNDDENRETIKDYSGNGNDAVAHNFAWNEEGSGYKDGVLVFDGVDDYVSLDAFDSGFKTMFMVCKPFTYGDILYDQRTNFLKNDYALYTEKNRIAYNARNLNGTFINKKLSSYKIDEVINKKQLIMIKSQLTEIYLPVLGCNATQSDFFANMALYKFLGFKEELTEEQIQYVIKKYNLLDGVDEIEVS